MKEGVYTEDLWFAPGQKECAALGNLLCREESWGGATKSVCPRKTSLGDRRCFFSLLRMNLVFTAFKQT